MAHPTFTVEVTPAQPRRGEAVDVLVTVLESRGDTTTEVGILCREWFTSVDERDNTVWVETTVHEQRARAEPIPGEHRLEFELPVETPFSYEGESVRYRWEAFAVQPVRFRPDRRETVLFEVLP